MKMHENAMFHSEFEWIPMDSSAFRQASAGSSSWIPAVWSQNAWWTAGGRDRSGGGCRGSPPNMASNGPKGHGSGLETLCATPFSGPKVHLNAMETCVLRLLVLLHHLGVLVL